MAIHTMQERIAELRARTSKAMLGGGADRLEKQRKGGKLTARDRVEALVDADSFEESGLFAEHRATLFGMAGKDFPADGVVTGAATVGGRLVHLASQDWNTRSRPAPRSSSSTIPAGRACRRASTRSPAMERSSTPT